MEQVLGARKPLEKKTDVARFIALHDLWISGSAPSPAEFAEENKNRYDFDVVRGSGRN